MQFRQGGGGCQLGAPNICSACYPVTLGLGVPARIHQTGPVLAAEIQEEKHGISIPTTEKRGFTFGLCRLGPPTLGPPLLTQRADIAEFYPDFTWEMATFLASSPQLCALSLLCSWICTMLPSRDVQLTQFRSHCASVPDLSSLVFSSLILR